MTSDERIDFLSAILDAVSDGSVPAYDAAGEIEVMIQDEIEKALMMKAVMRAKSRGDMQ